MEFVSTYGPMIHGYCRLRRLQETDALDVAQEVMVRLTKTMGGFEYDPSLGRFRDWLGVVVHRELLRFWTNKERNKKEDIMKTDLASVHDDAKWIEYFQSEILHRSLENIEREFAADTWQAFHMTWVENIPAASVAKTLGLGIESVYVAKSRALKRLRAEVSRLTEDLPYPEVEHVTEPRMS